jgi:hypothetical protein
MSEIQLRTGRSKKTTPDVDHTVAFALWDKMVKGWAEEPGTEEQALPVVNQLGNCSLLEKSFNISKSDKSLKSFMEQVHEIKNGKVMLHEWAKTLAIADVMLDPATGSVDEIAKSIDEREALIRKEVVEFVNGTRNRVDV